MGGGGDFAASGTAKWLGTGAGTAAEGTFELEVAVAGRCRVQVSLANAAKSSSLLAVANGKASSWRGPAAFAGAPLPAGMQSGCALLPQGLWLAGVGTGTAVVSGGGAAGTIEVRAQAAPGSSPVVVSLDPATGLPTMAKWSRAGHVFVVRYERYQTGAGLAFPSEVTEEVDGQRLWRFEIKEVEARSGLPDTDFEVEAPAAAAKNGGAQ